MMVSKHYLFTDWNNCAHKFIILFLIHTSFFFYPPQLRWAALHGFSKLSEPLEGLVTILEGCPGKQKGRSHTLGHHILNEFQSWMTEHPQVDETRPINF